MSSTLSLGAWLSRIRCGRRTIVGLNARNRELVEVENPRKLRALVDDKLAAKARLADAGVPVPETLHVCHGLIHIPPVIAALRERDGFVLKPACGAAGRGVVVIHGRCGPGGWVRADGDEVSERALAEHMAETVFGGFSRRQEDAVLVEELIRPHTFFSWLSAHGLSDVRLLVYRGVPVMAMIRVPLRGSSGRANLHAGGLGIGIDIESGRLTGGMLAGQTVRDHPETGHALVGLAVPEWERIVDVGVRAARAFPLGYLGVDIVLDQSGRALTLEVNARAGLEIQNVCGEGLKTAFERRGVWNE